MTSFFHNVKPSFPNANRHADRRRRSVWSRSPLWSFMPVPPGRILCIHYPDPGRKKPLTHALPPMHGALVPVPLRLKARPFPPRCSLGRSACCRMTRSRTCFRLMPGRISAISRLILSSFRISPDHVAVKERKCQREDSPGGCSVKWQDSGNARRARSFFPIRQISGRLPNRLLISFLYKGFDCRFDFRRKFKKPDAVSVEGLRRALPDGPYDFALGNELPGVGQEE